MPAPIFDGDIAHALTDAAQTYRALYYRPTRGNAGDSLINAGFYSLCASLGIEYHEVGPDFDYSTIRDDELLILSGGGYIVPYWTGGSELIETVTRYSFPLLLLPQSVAGREDVLRRLRPTDTLYLREKYSLDYALGLNLSCRLGLDHDLAFRADPNLISLETPAWPPNRKVKDFRKLAYCQYHHFRSTLFNQLNAFRTDNESVHSGPKSKINDVSSVAKFGTKSRLENMYSANKMLELLSRYQHVSTDRLHVMIGCVLTGTSVTAFDNAYHKIRGVYEYSILPAPERAALVKYSNAA